jgi:hypothetical protein
MFKRHPSLIIVALCVACGSSFEASPGGAGSGAGGAGSGAGGAGQAGQPASGGEAASAGSESGGAAGAPDMGGGGTVSGGGGAAAGTGAAGGSETAGSGGSAGADCTALKTAYSLALEKARACDVGSTDQCTKSSTLPPAAGCGCAVLVNAKSAATTAAKAKYQEYQDAKCSTGVICNDIACLAYATASCAVQSTTTSSAYVCTGSSALAN